jgi:transposase
MHESPQIELTPKSWTSIQLEGVCFMSKYSFEFKKKVVQYHIDARGGWRKTAAHFGIDHATLRKWYAAYLLHGPSALSRPYRSYTLEDKLKVIRRMEEENWSTRQASAFFNIGTPSTVQTWLIRYNKGGADALVNQPRGRPMSKQKQPNRPVVPAGNPLADMSPEDTRHELEYLRAENAYLKKLDALIQEKRSASKKKH